MASGKIKGITVEIGGDTTKLGQAIGDIEKQSNSLKGELKQVEKLLKMDPGNADLMAQKQEILTRAVAETSEKLKVLKEAQAQVEEQFKNGEIGEDQYRAFQRELIKTENELKGFKKELDGTDDDIDDVGESAGNSSEGFTIMKGALADLVSNAITSAISAIGDLIGSLFELSEATEEYRQMQAKLSGSAETFGYSAEFATQKYKEFYKYLGDDQASTNAITNLMGIGAETETVSRLAEGATAVWASYGDSIPIESLTESINETITVGKVTGTMADTINWCKEANEGLNKALSDNKDAQQAFNDALSEGLPVEDAFNEALAKITDEQERADVVAKFLNETYGASKATYDEMSGSILDANEAELALKETQAQLGQAVEPVNTALSNLKNQALMVIAPLVQSLANAFMELYNWLQQNPVAMQIVTTVAIALASAFTILAGALMIQGIISGVTKAIALLNTTLLANPIVLIISLIAGLVAGFIYLWTNCDAFREFWINLWNKIKEVASTVKDTLVEFFTVTIPEAWQTFKDKASEIITAVVDFFKELPGKIWNAIVGAVTFIVKWGIDMRLKAIEAVVTLVSNVFNKAKELPSKIWSAIVGAVTKVKEWGVNLASTAKSAITTMITNILDTAKSIPGKFLQIGKDIINGIKQGISSAIGGLYSSIKSSLSGLVDKAKKALGINSPSKVFANTVGIAIPEGIAKGIDDNVDIAEDSVTDLADDMIAQADKINGLTLNRQMETTFKGSVSSDTKILDQLSDIAKRLEAKTQIVLDTGVLVGETVDRYDRAFASKKTQVARGW